MGQKKLYTVGEIANKCGLTVRTLQFYDRSGLLTPSCYSEGGRRLYDTDAVWRLQQILFYKEFGFSLNEIRDQLMSIRSAQDFANRLIRQKSFIEKQIQYLSEMVSLMNQAIEGIQQKEDISVNTMIAILSVIKQNHMLSFTVKSFSQDELHAFIHAAELNDGQEKDYDWNPLLLRLEKLYQSGEDPLGPEGEKLAAYWWDKVQRLTGGDPGLMSTAIKAGKDMSGWPREAEGIRMAIQSFLAPALGQFLAQRGISFPEMEEGTTCNTTFCQ